MAAPLSQGVIDSDLAEALSRLEGATGIDSDGDGLDDGLEQSLAERFAPILFYAADEPNLPAEVRWFLARTEVRYFHKNCQTEDRLVASDATGIAGGSIYSVLDACDNKLQSSTGCYDRRRKRTLYLKDVTSEARKGCPDPTQWVTYLHAYPSFVDGRHGVTLQYWHFHAYNSGLEIWPVEFGFHGGDWEVIQVVLAEDLSPLKVRYTSHSRIIETAWNDPSLHKRGEHPMVVVERGGHAGRNFRESDNDRALLTHETWRGGRIEWPEGNVFGYPSGRVDTSPGLVNVGEKTRPTPEGRFLWYAGLWGSPGTNFSGFWGPGLNETEMEDDFVKAWAWGMEPGASPGHLGGTLAIGEAASGILVRDAYIPIPTG